MSLFTIQEICEDCDNAEICSECNKVKGCNKGQDNINCMTGRCEDKIVKGKHQ